MIFQEDPRGEWRRHDFLLLEALQLMEQERCGQCGLPVWMCHDETGLVQFSIEEDECIAKRDVDKKQEVESKKDKKSHGINYYPRPFFVEGASWVEVRDAHYERQAEIAKEREGD